MMVLLLLLLLFYVKNTLQIAPILSFLFASFINPNFDFADICGFCDTITT